MQVEFCHIDDAGLLHRGIGGGLALHAFANGLHIDPWRVPAKRAIDNPAALRQELNLKYVIETRAKHTLIEANAEGFQP